MQPLTNANNVQVHRSTDNTPFIVVLSCQPSGLTTANMASAIPDKKMEPPQLQSFCSRFLLQMYVRHKEMDAKLVTAQACYKRTSDRTVGHKPQLRPGKPVFADRPSAQMNESARMASAQVRKLLPKTFGTFKQICATPHTGTVNKNGIHNIISIRPSDPCTPHRTGK